MTGPILESLAKRIAADVAAGRTPDPATLAEYQQRTAPKPRSTRKQYGAPMRNFRLDDERWARVNAAAARADTTASDVLRELVDTLPEA